MFFEVSVICGFPRLEENLGFKVTLNLQGEFVSIHNTSSTANVMLYTVRKIASYNLYRYGLPRTCCIYTEYNLQIVFCIDADSNLSMQIVVCIYADCILCQCRQECHSRLHSVSMQIV